ncbi:MAG TPA: permease [Epsilonproteobacteria bacterium]|nr:permease [Campylobacterota bacterium]
MRVKFRGLRFFLFVFLLYLLLYFSYPGKTLAGLGKAAEILTWILPLFVVVILFTAMINFFLKPKQIASHLGQESGIKGWLIAMLAGVISHGPMYAWYPMIEDLKKHGLKSGLIATFFYARALKVPLLPLMIEYFGWVFTVTLSVYILISSLLQGMLIESWCRGCREDTEEY